MLNRIHVARFEVSSWLMRLTWYVWLRGVNVRLLALTASRRHKSSKGILLPSKDKFPSVVRCDILNTLRVRTIKRTRILLGLLCLNKLMKLLRNHPKRPLTPTEIIWRQQRPLRKFLAHSIPHSKRSVKHATKAELKFERKAYTKRTLCFSWLIIIVTQYY